MLAGLMAAIDVLEVPISCELYEARRKREAGDMAGALSHEMKARMLQGMVKLIRYRASQEALRQPLASEERDALERLLEQVKLELSDKTPTGEFPLPWGARRDED